MKKLLAILVLSLITPAAAAEKWDLCDASLMADDGTEVIVEGTIENIWNSKSFDIDESRATKCGGFTVSLKKPLPKNCKVGSIAEVQGTTMSDSIESTLVNATAKCK